MIRRNRNSQSLKIVIRKIVSFSVFYNLIISIKENAVGLIFKFLFFDWIWLFLSYVLNKVKYMSWHSVNQT
jgi:hypothetical protein